MTGAAARHSPLRTLLGAAPIALPQLLALLVVIVASAPEGGYPLAHWAPAGVVVALLLAVALLTLPPTAARPPLSAVSIAGIAGVTLWSALSIGWSADHGAAAIGTTRTAFLATTFILFAHWRHQPRTALTVLAAAAAGLGAMTWVTALSLLATGDIDPWFFYDRLLEPVGYVNAGAAFWGVVGFVGVGLLGGRIHPALRIGGALIAVPAAALSFLCLSRGGLLADAAVIVLLLAALPGRARNATALAVVALPLATAAPLLADVGNAARLDPNAIVVVHQAIARTIGAAVLAAALTAGWAMLDARIDGDAPLRRHTARIGGALVGLALAVAAIAFAVNAGPVTRDRAAGALRTIKSTSYNAVAPGENRLTSDLSSGRWQFWVVGWQQFEAHRWRGAGADNFRQDFLLRGKGSESPAYPHSIVVRTLGQLGLIGGVLMLLWIVPILMALRRLAADADPARRTIAIAVGGAFGLWLLHGSVDWLLEYAGLTAIVAALAGLAVAAAPAGERPAPRVATSWRRRVAGWVAALL
ncbi:MAG: O-antigen ligase family protein, partial [Patulibacter sp.]